jgi:hypothetical protein
VLPFQIQLDSPSEKTQTKTNQPSRSWCIPPMERLSRWLGLALVLLFVGVVAAQEEGNEINFIFAGMLPERRSTSPHPADRIFYAQGSSLYGPDFGRTYYRESGDGVPLAVGFEMTENTPVVLGKAIPTSSLYSVLFLDLPQEARIKTPLQFMTAHFSPIGHPPAGTLES